MAFFPEVFSNKGDKFSRLAIWLVTSESIVCPNIRDMLTAGGKSDLLIGKKIYKNVPRIFVNLIQNIHFVTEIINITPASELSEQWGKNVSEKNKMTKWIELVNNEAQKISDATHIDLKAMINISLLK